MIKVQAWFIGMDGSLGFKKKTKYNLIFLISSSKIKIVDEVSQTECIYDSMRAFLNNWKVC